LEAVLDEIDPPFSKRKAFKMLALLEYLRGKPRSKDEIIEHFKAKDMTLSKSGLERCLRDLYDWDVDLTHIPDNFSTTRKYFIPQKPPRMQPLETLLTHTAVRLIYHHSPGYHNLYFTALEKLSYTLPQHAREIAERSTQDLKEKRSQEITLGDSVIDLGRNLEMVALSWFEQRVLSFEYLSPNGSGAWRKKELEVYFLEVARTNLGLYVIGYERSFHKQVVTFKLNRMKNVGNLERLEQPTIPDFDPKAFLSNAWGVIGSSGGGLMAVRLLFAKEAAHRILEQNYPSLELVQEHENGALEVVVTVGTDGQNFPLELLSWVQSWGPRVEVLEPPPFRKRWLDEARAVAEKFGKEI
jgi:predicted DNA-binding transcriptional regulator YafY